MNECMFVRSSIPALWLPKFHKNCMFVHTNVNIYYTAVAACSTSARTDEGNTWKQIGEKKSRCWYVAIGARVALLWQNNVNAKCYTRCMPSSIFVYIFSYIFDSYLASQGFVLNPHWGNCLVDHMHLHQGELTSRLCCWIQSNIEIIVALNFDANRSRG